MRPRLARAVGWLLALALCGACGTLERLAGGLERPDARIVGVTLEDLALDGLTLGFDVEVHNPYDVELPVVGLDYSLASAGGPAFLAGDFTPESGVPAGGRRTLRVPARLAFAELLRVLEGVRPGAVVPYTAALGVAVDAPGLGRLRLPLERSGELPVPTLPAVRVSALRWRELSLSGARAVLELAVDNGNDFPVDVERLGVGLALGGHTVLESAVPDRFELIRNGQRTVRVPFRLSTAEVARAGLGLLTGESADYELSGELSLGTPFGPLASAYRTGGRTPMSR